MLYLLTDNKAQLQAKASLYHLTASTELERQFKTFLLACKVAGLSPYTIHDYEYQIGRFVRFCLEQQVADGRNVTTTHIRLFFLKLQETNNPISVSDYYKSIKRFFNWLIEEGILQQSPMQNVKLGRLPQKVIRPFSNEDIERLLLLCSGDRFLDLRNRAMVLVFLDTGLRLSEVANIRIQDIDFDREVIKVMGKGAKERVVRIGQETQKALLKYLLARNDDNDCLWVTEERKPMTKDGIQTTIKVLCKRANIKDAKPGPHTFRHTAAIHCLRNGMGEFTLQMMLGHSTLRMTRQYVSALADEDIIKAHRQASPVDNLFKNKK